MKIDYLTFLDIETTGFAVDADPPTDPVIEVAAAKVSLKTREIVDQYEALVKPWGPRALFYNFTEKRSCWWELDQYHVKNKHFEGVDWSSQKIHGEVWIELSRRFLINGATLAGQNPSFDIRHLRREFGISGRPWPVFDYHVPDLASSALYLAMAGKIKSCSLRHTVPWAYAEPGREQQHRAGPDVRDSIKVFWAMHDFFIHGIEPWPGSGPTCDKLLNRGMQRDA